MAEGYSGLRIRRKRVHSAKCSCCCSEDPPASTRKEAEGEGNSKTQHAAKKGQRSKGQQNESADENNNRSEDEVHSTVTNSDSHKSPGGSRIGSGVVNTGDSCDTHLQPARKKVARSRNRGGKKKKTAKPEREDLEATPAEGVKKNRPQGSSDRRSTRIAKNVQSNKTKSKSSNPKQGNGNANLRVATVGDPDRSSDHKEENARSKTKRIAADRKTKGKREQKQFRGNDDEFQRNNVGMQPRNLSKTKAVGKRKAFSNQDGRRSARSGRVNSVKSGSNGVRSSGNAEGSDSRIANRLQSSPVGSDGETAVTSTSLQDESSGTQEDILPTVLDHVSKTKIAVFDHLLEVLRKCPGQDTATLDNAITFFMGLNVGHLSAMLGKSTARDSIEELGTLDKAVLGRYRDAAVHVEENNQGPRPDPDSSAAPPQPPNISQCGGRADKMNLSEAAETLVSIKSNPVSRQDSSNPSSAPANELTNDGAENQPKPPDQPLATQLLDTAPFFIPGPMQGIAPGEVLHNSSTQLSPLSPLPSLGLQQPAVFPQLPLGPLMGAVPQFAMGTNTFAPLGQFFTQSSCNPLGAITTSISVTTAPSTVTSRAPAMSVPALLFGGQQSLLSFPPMPVTSSSGASVSSSFGAQGNTLPALPPLPLKGMEEVIGNVGVNSPSVMWNVKPSPVVYLASPQTLGGVPRNLVTGVTQKTQGIPIGNESNALPPGLASMAQNLDPSLKLPSVAPAVPATSVQRPILPREHVTSAAPTLPALKPATQVASGTGVLTANNNAGHSGSIRHAVSSTSSTPSQPVSSLGVTTGSATSAALLTAKQAVKRFVRERTRSAEQRREGGLPGLDDAQPPCQIETPLNARGGNANTQQAGPSMNPDFNLQQAATTLLSIAVPEGTDMAEGDDSPEEPEEEVVFTSKGMFRVGDVDVDPQYNSIGKEGYTCGKCGKIFTSLSYLARHIKRVCPDMSCRKWKCNRCDKAFRHPFGLQQHIYTHTGERPHKCPECPKAFYSSNDLRRHSRIHSGERPYQCKHCDKTFATTISLKTHTYIHTGEKPHKCPHCPKTFATSSKLGRHIVTHSEQRPYSCGQCPKAFNRSGDLRRHSLHVHDIRDKSAGEDEATSAIHRLDDPRGASTEA